MMNNGNDGINKQLLDRCRFDGSLPQIYYLSNKLTFWFNEYNKAAPDKPIRRKSGHWDTTTYPHVSSGAVCFFRIDI